VSGQPSAGLLLAAGAGRRMGGPKALLRGPDGTPFLDKAVSVLREGGCTTVAVVLGAAADEARQLLAAGPWGNDPAVHVVVAGDWAEGMGASLRAGLGALPALTDSTTALVTLVDLPDVDGPVVRRVLERVIGSGSLVRATYGGRPGHPVLIGRDHWAGVRAAARGDEGARGYFRTHQPEECECGDLATGRDVDRPADLDP
jgi:CTP:molybdopterin cytidylyltransferase MocA